MKRLSVLVFVVAILMTMMSCCAGAEALEPVEKHVTYLTVLTPQQVGYKSMEMIVEKYQKEVNPGFTMDIQYIADRPAYLQKLKTLVASNEMPDMFNIDAEPYASVLMKEGYLQDIGPTLEKYGLYDVFLAAPLAWGCLPSGIQYGVPIDYSIELFWYNKDMFEKAGAQIPTTFDEFLTTCETLKNAGFTPISVSGKEAWPPLRYLDFVTYRYGHNQFLFDLAQGKQKMSSEIGMKAVNFLKDLGTKGYFQTGFASVDYTGALDYFLGGNAAIHYNGTWELESIQGANDEVGGPMENNIGFFVMPHVNEGDEEVGPADYAANSTTPIGFAADKYDEEMERFIDFYARNVSEIAKGRAFSCSVGGECPFDSELAIEVFDLMQNSIGAMNLYDVELDPATNELIGKEAVSLALGDISPEEFAERIDESIAENAPDFFN